VFEYNFHEKAKILSISLPDKINFDVAFLNEITLLVKKISNKDCEEVRISCSPDAVYDKLSKAYFLNVLRSFLPQKSIKWSKNLANLINPKVHAHDGSKFEEIDMIQMITGDELDYYRFRDDGTVAKPVGEMTKLLVEKNVTLNTDQIKEFLSTTIGEIFSNCFLHSNKDEAFLMFDVSYKEGQFYLCVNITDYGTILINNVKSHFNKRHNRNIDSIECFEWAMQEGTTTRKGSGGYGLATLTDYISQAKGELYIFSGDAYYCLKNKHSEVKYCKGYFGGTSVTFQIKLFETSLLMAFDSSENKLVTISLDNI